MKGSRTRGRLDRFCAKYRWEIGQKLRNRSDEEAEVLNILDSGGVRIIFAKVCDTGAILEGSQQLLEANGWRSEVGDSTSENFIYR